MEQNNSVNNNKQRRPLILHKCTYLIFQAANFFIFIFYLIVSPIVKVYFSFLQVYTVVEVR